MLVSYSYCIQRVFMHQTWKVGKVMLSGPSSSRIGIKSTFDELIEDCHCVSQGVCVCELSCKHAWVDAFVSVCVRVSVSMCACISSMRVLLRVCVYACVCLCMCVYVCMHSLITNNYYMSTSIDPEVMTYTKSFRKK
jgi:hypothetical protein